MYMGAYGGIDTEAITIKIGKMGTGGTCACMIWAPGWPGNFPVHHVVTHFAKNQRKRVSSTQNMKQAPQK